jgi:hypothetical protein
MEGFLFLDRLREMLLGLEIYEENDENLFLLCWAVKIWI